MPPAHIVARAAVAMSSGRNLAYRPLVKANDRSARKIQYELRSIIVPMEKRLDILLCCRNIAMQIHSASSTLWPRSANICRRAPHRTPEEDHQMFLYANVQWSLANEQHQNKSRPIDNVNQASGY